MFRALNTFQPRTGGPVHPADVVNATASSLGFSLSDYDSEVAQISPVWSRGQLSAYLSYSSPESVSRGRSPPSDSDSTASDVERRTLLEMDDPIAGTIGEPSLGYLDEALEFLAAERAKLLAQRELGLKGNSSSTTTTTTSDGVWRHVIQPRRKRRRKKNRSVQEVSRVRISERDQETLTESTTADDHDGDADDGYDSSSSVDVTSSPQARAKAAASFHDKQDKQGKRRPRPLAPTEKLRLHHSKSTPNLIPPVSIPLDARALHLRNLAHKLRLFFPQDVVALRTILSPESANQGFVDTRGPEPRSQDTLIHVFIDHSNILIGFLSYLRRHAHRVTHIRSRYMSHAALALILERGRPITRRVLVASSPLYQPVNTAEQLGYEVRVYARVPDTGDGADRQPHISHTDHHTPSRIRGRKGGPSQSQKHSHRTSMGGGTSTESDAGGNGNGNGVAGGNATRVRYREQGVDELLQLKLHQAIADADEVPPGATIVLATGDGNVGQFNEEGFLGCVRTALKKGWRVELYAWEGGLSRAWMREFGEGSFSSRFEVHMLDRFAADLLEV